MPGIAPPYSAASLGCSKQEPVDCIKRQHRIDFTNEVPTSADMLGRYAFKKVCIPVWHLPGLRIRQSLLEISFQLRSEPPAIT
jgi:hypothetical protein